MAYLTRQDELWTTIDEVSSSHDLIVYDLERCGPDKLSVVIARSSDHLSDAQPKVEHELDQGGVTSDDCSRIVRELMVYFQANGDRFGLGAEPQIEVSSPGVNRRLRLAEHYIGAVGERVKITGNGKVGGDSEKVGLTVVGPLVYCDGKVAKVEDESTEDKKQVEFSLGDIRKARVDFDFGD